VGAEFEGSEKTEVHSRLTDAEEGAKDEVWGG
jgi:hypothetical protein